MRYILKVKNEKGEWITIPALHGKSAYDYAVELGYEGTEEEYKLACEAQRILSIVQTKTSTEGNGSNVWTATFGHGGTANLVVRNGANANGITAKVVDGELVISDYSEKTEFVVLEDIDTGKMYRLFVSNGKLMLSGSEG